MRGQADDLDLAALRLSSGEGRRIEGLEVGFDPLDFGGERYTVPGAPVPVVVDVSRMTSDGHALRLRFDAALEGPCMRCLIEAGPAISVDAREVHQPGGGEELTSPYVDEGGRLDLRAWARDALVLALPAQILCKPDCAGLCPECGADLNVAGRAGEVHAHERPPDPRWAALRELKLD